MNKVKKKVKMADITGLEKTMAMLGKFLYTSEVSGARMPLYITIMENELLY